MKEGLPKALSTRLRAAGTPARAQGAQAYMKTSDPFFGVDAPTLRRILREFYGACAPEDGPTYQRQIAALWALPEREGKYAAIEWARRFKGFITLDALPLYERMIREGQWWDTVDAIAAHLTGALLLHHRKAMKPVIEAWSRDENLWIRRAALLAHLTHKERTDEAQLFAHCLRLAHEKDFFIRKAIGWALRAYSIARPDTVRAFLASHRDHLSGLSYREANKRLMKLAGPPAREHQAKARSQREP